MGTLEVAMLCRKMLQAPKKGLMAKTLQSPGKGKINGNEHLLCLHYVQALG